MLKILTMIYSLQIKFLGSHGDRASKENILEFLLLLSDTAITQV